MTISTIQLAYLPRNNQNALFDWLREHGDWHRRVAEKALKDGHSNIGTFPIYDMANKDDWAYFHNTDHEEISSTYHLSTPPDLSYWDFDDEVNFANWLFAHALVHQDIQKGLSL